MSRVFLLAIIIASLGSNAVAQVTDQTRQQRREFIGGLLKTLIESQLDDDPRVNPNLRNRDRVPTPVPARSATRELRQIRTSLVDFSRQTDQLVADLQNAQHESPQARMLLADAMTVKAQTDGLVRRANFATDHREIIPAYQELDQNWRVLIHRVQQSPGIDRECIGHCKKLQTLGNEMCTCLGVEPTFNRAELVRLTSALNLSFQHLLQDLYYDFRDDNRVARILDQGRELQTKIGQASASIHRESYENIVSIYKETVRDWRRFSRKLRPFRSERIRRDIQEIESLGQAIHEQLWLPVQLDAEHILDVARSIEADANKLFSSISLNDLLQCQKPGNVLNSAREFQRRCGTFTSSLENGLESWIWDYRLFNVQWQTLLEQCRPIDQPRVARQLRSIDDSMQSLNQLLGQGPVISRDELIQLAAQLDQLATDCQLIARREVVSNRIYGRRFRDDFSIQAKRLHDSIHRWHQTLVRSGHQFNMNDDLRTIIDQWVAFKQLINQCNDIHRAAFNPIRREIEPRVVKLQVIFSS